MLQTGPIIFRFRGLLGVPVEIGQTLAFLILLFLGLSLSAGGNIVWLTVVIAMILAAIYLHELGHAWASKIQGVPVRRIVLHGGGGFCEHDHSASAAQDEFIIAMGPLVNLALWAISSLLVEWAWSSGLGSGALGHYLWLFGQLNILFFFFNLIPVQPLDGGKFLHSVLLRFMDPRTAMRLAGAVGLAFAILWWPALFYIWYRYGLILLFLPSIRLHYQMMKGEIRF